MKKEEGKKEGDVFTIRGKKATMEGGKVTTKWLGSWSLRYSELKREDFLIPSSTVSRETWHGKFSRTPNTTGATCFIDNEGAGGVRGNVVYSS